MKDNLPEQPKSDNINKHPEDNIEKRESKQNVRLWAGLELKTAKAGLKKLGVTLSNSFSNFFRKENKNKDGVALVINNKKIIVPNDLTKVSFEELEDLYEIIKGAINNSTRPQLINVSFLEGNLRKFKERGRELTRVVEAIKKANPKDGADTGFSDTEIDFIFGKSIKKEEDIKKAESLSESANESIYREMSVEEKINKLRRIQVGLMKKQKDTKKLFSNDVPKVSDMIDALKAETEKGYIEMPKIQRQESLNEDFVDTLVPSMFKERLNKSKEKLKSFGLKSIDEYNKLPPKSKIAVGLVFAGLGVATGGASTIFTKSLAITSSSKLFYDAEIKKLKQQKNNTPLGQKEIKEAALKSIALASFIGIVGPQAFEYSKEIVNLFELEDAIDFAKEKGKTFVDWFKIKTPNISIPINNVEILRTPSPIPDIELPKVMEESKLKVEEIIPTPDLGTYEVKQGDRLEKILLNNLKFPEGLTAEDKLNKIYNLMGSRAGESLLLDSGVKDINIIQEGQKLDLDKFTKLLK